MPHGRRTFQMDFDFTTHELQIVTGEGTVRSIGLYPRSVADFYAEVSSTLQGLDLPVKIWTRPAEIPNAIPFEDDHEHTTYDRDEVYRLWQALVHANRVMTFRCRFVGKASPVHFFWGAFDLAVSRFSGRPAPPHPSMPGMADWVTREAYSHEVSSCGFWPGNADYGPNFYAYVYPEPPELGEATVRPDVASYHPQLGEFVLPYSRLQTAADPDADLLDFFQTTYDAAADLGAWDRAALERAP